MALVLIVTNILIYLGTIEEMPVLNIVDTSGKRNMADWRPTAMTLESLSYISTHE